MKNPAPHGGPRNKKRKMNTTKETALQNLLTAGYIILAENRGDYITRLQFQPDGDFEIHGGSAEEAIRYTLDQATSLVNEMGRGYSIEPAPAND